MPRLQRIWGGKGQDCLFERDQSGNTWPVRRLVQVRDDKTLNQDVGSGNKEKGRIVDIFFERII